MKKKADLSIQVLIFAAIGLVVLIVLLAIFTGKAKIFSRSVGGSCDDQGGICADSDGSIDGKCDDSNYPIKVLAKGCFYYNARGVKQPGKDIGQCCLPLGT